MTDEEKVHYRALRHAQYERSKQRKGEYEHLEKHFLTVKNLPFN